MTPGLKLQFLQPSQRLDDGPECTLAKAPVVLPPNEEPLDNRNRRQWLAKLQWPPKYPHSGIERPVLSLLKTMSGNINHVGPVMDII